MTKAILRLQNLKFRSSISSQTSYTKSIKIFNNLIISKIWKNSSTIHVYKSISGEVNTDKIINKAFEDGKEVYIPITTKDNELVTAKVGRGTVYGKGKFGIWEPINDFEIVKKDEFDLIIIPLVGFDSDNNRVGYGKGCYDKFLARAKGYRVGLGFQWQKAHESIDTDQFDQKLDWVCSE